MSLLGNKIREVFGPVSVYKSPDNNDVFIGRNIPSFVKDYLVSIHIMPDGTLNKSALINFLNERIPDNANAVRADLKNGKELALLTRFEVITNIADNLTHFQIPEMGIKAKETQIASHVINQNTEDLIDGEKWGLIKLVYIPPLNRQKGYIEMIRFKPFRPNENLDMASFRKCRSQFSTEEWIDVLISASEYNPNEFHGLTQKLEFLTRLLPFVEPKLNMIELAPKGTGKSYVFGNLSKHVWLIGGGKVSRAKLFYDKSRRIPGIIYNHDVVALDEIQSISFTDMMEMRSILKSYLEYGKTNVDSYEFMSECGLMLLGNIELTEEGIPQTQQYTDALPEAFRESALLDRFHGFIEGWFLPRINTNMVLRDWTLNVEFFSEVLHQLRTAPEHSILVNQLISVPDGADLRHTTAVRRMATAYMKLLFPHIINVEEVDKEEFYRYCLAPSIHRRDILRMQCSYIDREPSFSKPMPDYSVK